MSIQTILDIVDEFGRTMRDSGKSPASVEPAALNRQREELHEAIRALAVTGDPSSVGPATLEARRAIERAAIPPVDRDARTLTDGSPVTPDHREIDPASGQQRAYVVLSAEERAKGFVRPVRRSYVHAKCGVVTTMGQALAETYARDPGFYSGTFCVGCRAHFPVGADGEFTWDGTTEKVGT